jgi:hypothetical protein
LSQAESKSVPRRRVCGKKKSGTAKNTTLGGEVSEENRKRHSAAVRGKTSNDERRACTRRFHPADPSATKKQELKSGEGTKKSQQEKNQPHGRRRRSSVREETHNPSALLKTETGLGLNT